MRTLPTTGQTRYRLYQENRINSEKNLAILNDLMTIFAKPQIPKELKKFIFLHDKISDKLPVTLFTVNYN